LTGPRPATSPTSTLAQRFGKGELLALAAEVDRGIDREVFIQMLASLDRFTDDELPVPAADVAAVRAFFGRWARELMLTLER